MRRACAVMALVAVLACDEGWDDEAGEPTLAASIPVYDGVWNPRADGETLVKIRGIQLGEEEMVTVGLGHDDSSRVEFRIFRTSGGELTASVDVYDTAGVHLDSGERSYGVGSHTNWKHYSDTDNYGMNIRIQSRNNGHHIYHLKPAINGLIAKKTAHADSAARAASNGIYTTAELPPPERGMVVLTDKGNEGRCVSVRVKGTEPGWRQKLPRLFEAEDGSVISEQDNMQLSNDYLVCLRARGLLKN